MKLYIRAKSKKEINERLAAGDQVIGVNHSAFGGGGTYDLTTAPDGTTIAVWEKTAPDFFGDGTDGSPVAKSYGTWDAKKLRVK